MAKAATPAKDPYKELEEKYGKGTIVQMNNETFTPPKAVTSTGSMGLDRATGIGGVPAGIIEIYGPESSGKTTIATHIAIQAQKKGRMALIVDAEHAFDFKYAQRIGLMKEFPDGRSALTYIKPYHGEMGFDSLKMLIKTGNYGCAILDSVAGNIPKEQHEGETGQSRMARLAALMSLELPKLVPPVDDAECCMIFLNQIRNNIGGYGNPEKPAGGDSLKFYCLMRMVVRKVIEKEAGRNKTTVEVIKNKCAPPFGKAEFYIDWGLGINHTNEILDYAVEYDLIKKGGSWYTIEEDNKFQGEEKTLEFLNDNPGLLEKYEKLIKDKWYEEDRAN